MPRGYVSPRPLPWLWTHPRAKLESFCAPLLQLCLDSRVRLPIFLPSKVVWSAGPPWLLPASIICAGRPAQLDTKTFNSTLTGETLLGWELLSGLSSRDGA